MDGEKFKKFVEWVASKELDALSNMEGTDLEDFLFHDGEANAYRNVLKCIKELEIFKED